MKKTQTQVILEHLKKYKSITSMEAFEYYGITRLSSVIFLLKKDGHNISSKLKETKNRLGGYSHFSEYSLCD